MLNVEGLVKYYRRTPAVDGVTFTVNDGEIVGLLGPNGAGKTTILRCVTGIVQPTEGKIVVNGIDLAQDEAGAKRNIAFVPEVPSPYEMLTVYEHMQFVAMAYGTSDQFEQRAQWLLETFELNEKRHDFVLSLSKGMKQKLAIACAFVHDARVLLFDEPLIGIDPKGAKELKDLIMRAKDAGDSILISTHMLDTAERLCDRIIILQHGKIIAEGTIEELRSRAHSSNNATLEELFLQLTEQEPEDVQADTVS